MNSKAIGEITEAIIISHIVKMGWSVSIPFGNNQRYDLIVDCNNGLLYKAQCKTGRLQNGCISFNTSSVNGFTNTRYGYDGQIDTFLVWSEYTDKVYSIPISTVGKPGSVLLRVDMNNGGNPSKIRWAQDYEIYKKKSIMD